VALSNGNIHSNEDLGKILKKNYKTLKLWNDTSLNSGILFLLFSLTVIFLIVAFWCFLSGLRAKIDPVKYKQPQMVLPSNIFWGDISRGSFFSYKYRLENSQAKDWIKDMQTQVYINSCICARKSKFYNTGINSLKISIIGFVVYHIWLWLVI
jgi:hypothetical protein